MKKLIILASAIFVSVYLFADSTTPRLGLTIPTIGSSNWGQKLNNNFSLIDTAVAGQTNTNTFTSTVTFQNQTTFSNIVNFSTSSVVTFNGITTDNSTTTITGMILIKSTVTITPPASASTALTINNAAGSTAITVSTNGVYGNVLQPAFLVAQAGVEAGVTGNGTVVVSTWDTVVYDRTNSFSVSTFTVPAAGLYEFGCHIEFQSLTASNTGAGVGIGVNSLAATGGVRRSAQTWAGGTYVSHGLEAVTVENVSVGDKITCLYFANGAASKTTTTGGDASFQFFWGLKLD